MDDKKSLQEQIKKIKLNFLNFKNYSKSIFNRFNSKFKNNDPNIKINKFKNLINKEKFKNLIKKENFKNLFLIGKNKLASSMKAISFNKDKIKSLPSKNNISTMHGATLLPSKYIPSKLEIWARQEESLLKTGKSYSLFFLNWLASKKKYLISFFFISCIVVIILGLSLGFGLKNIKHHFKPYPLNKDSKPLSITFNSKIDDSNLNYKITYVDQLHMVLKTIELSKGFDSFAINNVASLGFIEFQCYLNNKLINDIKISSYINYFFNKDDWSAHESKGDWNDSVSKLKQLSILISTSNEDYISPLASKTPFLFQFNSSNQKVNWNYNVIKYSNIAPNNYFILPHQWFDYDQFKKTNGIFSQYSENDIWSSSFYLNKFISTNQISNVINKPKLEYFQHLNKSKYIYNSKDSFITPDFGNQPTNPWNTLKNRQTLNEYMNNNNNNINLNSTVLNSSTLPSISFQIATDFRNHNFLPWKHPTISKAISNTLLFTTPLEKYLSTNSQNNAIFIYIVPLVEHHYIFSNDYYFATLIFNADLSINKNSNQKLINKIQLLNSDSYQNKYPINFPNPS